MSEWLNVTFSAFDGGAFEFMNGLALVGSQFFNPFFEFISFFGKGGIFSILLGVVLMLFKKTRYHGFAILLSIGIGALFTNLIIKKAVARPRPYTVDEFKQFWELAGKCVESEFSFPSGHVTVIMASMTAVFLTFNKKRSWTVYIFVFVMCFARVYLIQHYLTDVIGGLIIGGVSSVIAYFANNKIFKEIRAKENKFCNFVNNADIINLFKK
jgi:undecaprenyl-diphosphatase